MLAGVMSGARAVEIVWRSPRAGSWAISTNWSPAQVPGPGDVAVLGGNGTYVVTAAANVSIGGLRIGGPGGTKTLSIGSGEFQLGGPGSVEANGELRLLGGEFTGSGPLSIEGRWEWNGGTVDRIGEVNVAANGQCVIAGPGVKFFSGGTVRNRGTWRWTAGSIFSTKSTATLVNEAGAVAEFPGGYPWVGAEGRIENAGIWRKLGSGIGVYAARLSNRPEATMSILEGTASWTGGGSGGGTCSVSANAVNEFNAGVFTLEGATFTGSGTHRISGGTVTLGAGSRLLVPGSLAITAGTLRLASGASHEVARVTFTGGTWEGGDTLRTTGASSWTGGTLDVTGVWINGDQLVIDGPGVKFFSGGTLRNESKLLWRGGSIFSTSHPATLVNGAEAVAEFPGGYQWVGAEGRIDNSGTLRKVGSGIGVYAANVSNRSGATISIQEGTASWTGGGARGGTYSVSTNAVNGFDAGEFVFDAAALGGSGTHRISGGTVTLGAGSRLLVPGTLAITAGTLRLAAGVSHEAGRVILSGGTWEGSDTLRSTGASSWTGGTLDVTGVWINGDQLVIDGPGVKFFSGGTLRNESKLLWRGGSIFSTSHPATIVNEAAAVAEFPGGYQWVGAEGRIDNAGTWRKVGSGIGVYAAKVSNRSGATMSVVEGTASWTGGGSGGGTYSVTVNAVNEFEAGVFALDAATLTGLGTHRISGGRVTLGAGSRLLVPGTVTISAGTLRLAAGASHEVGGVILTGGAWEGGDTLRTTGASSWTGGTYDTTGVWINGDQLVIDGPGVKFFHGGTLRNESRLFWRSGSLFSTSRPATLANLAGATAEFPSGYSWVGAEGRITNAGLLRKTGTGTSSSLGGSFLNTGNFEAGPGSLSVQGAFTQAAGRTLLAGSSLVFGPASSRVEGGSVLGVGSLAFLGFDGGTNAPGDGVAGGPIGTLRFSPDFELGPNAVVELDLGGATPGTGHDQIVVEAAPGSAQLGVAVLGGLLRARLANGYSPPAGTRFTVLRSRLRTGSFARVELPPGFAVEYTASEVILRNDPPALSPFAETIESLAILNSDDYLLEADAADGDPATQRDLVRASASVLFVAPTFVPRTAGYRMEFQLVNSRGRRVLLRDGVGGTTDVVAVEQSVTLPRLRLEFGSELISQERVEFVAGLRPATRLDPGETYRVEANLVWRLAANAPFVPTGDSAVTPYRRFLHFTNTQSSDSGYNALAEVRSVQFLRAYAVESVPGRKSFRVQVPVRVHRYDGFADPVSSVPVNVELSGELREATTGERIPLVAASTTFTVSVPNHGAGTPARPATADQTVVLDLEPAANARVDILAGQYLAEVSVAHRDAPGTLVVRSSGIPGASAPQALLRFDGRLFFGEVETRFTAIANDPARRGVVAGQHVVTDLAVEPESGQSTQEPGVRYGNGQALPVRLFPDGRAELIAGSVAAVAPQPDIGEIEGLRFRRENLVLDGTGGRADLTLLLPAGLGYRLAAPSRLLRSQISLGRLALNSRLGPAEGVTVTFQADLAEETKPLWFPVRSLRWQVAAGQLDFEPAGPPVGVRAGEFNALETLADAGVLVDSAQGRKRSNDDYFRSVAQVASPRISIHADANGAAALDVQLILGSGQLDAHFPHAVKLAWGGGQLEIKRDQPVPANSRLVEVAQITSGYSPGCADCGTGPGLGMTTTPENNILRFTPDGGLVGAGALVETVDLTWGRMPGPAPGFAHRSIGYTEARFLMAGTFLAGSATANAPADRPQTLLLSGVLPADPTQFERPRTEGYALGAADYPGMNFRAGTDRAHPGEDILGGEPTGRWDLTGRSKYNVRASGVSGIHEAYPGSFRGPPRLSGYEVTLPNYGLSFLANAPQASRIEGSLHLPEASTVDLGFQRLGVTCLGDPTIPELPESEIGQLKQLRYWLADFVPLGMEFRRRAADRCVPGSGVLVLAVEAYASHVGSPLQGELGFLPSGEIVTPEDVRTGVARLDPPFDSGLILPASFTLAGPADEHYALIPAGKAYFTDFGSRPSDQQGLRPENIRGYLSFAAGMRLPFFREMPVHIHDTARREAPNSPIWIMAGGREAAWSVASDPESRGYPTRVTTDGYHDAKNEAGLSVHTHRPRARQRWLDLLDFDFPLEWSPSARSFRSVTEPQTAEWLFVLRTERRCRYLSASHADLTFGATAEAIPVFTFGQLAFEVGDQEYNLTESMIEAGFENDATAIRLGLQALADLANPNPYGLFQDTLRAAIQPDLTRFVDELAAARIAAPSDAAWLQTRDTLIRTYCSDATSRLAEVLQQDVASRQPPRIGQRFADAAQACGALRRLISRPDPATAARPVTREFIRGLLRGLNGNLASIVADLAGSAFGDLIDEHIGPQGAALDEMARRLGELEQGFRNLQASTEEGGAFQLEIRDLFTRHSADLLRVATTVGAGITSHLNRFRANEDPLAGSLRSEFRSTFTDLVKSGFLAQPIVPDIQTAIRLRVSEPYETFRESFDTTGAVLSDSLRSVASAGLRQLDEVFQEMLGDLVGVAAMANVTGHAHFTGDSMTALRVDGKMLLQLGLRLEFNGFIEVRALESDTPSDLCSAPGDNTVEVRFGATGSLTTFGRAPDPAHPGEQMDTSDWNAVSMWGKAAFRTNPQVNPAQPVAFLGFSGGLQLSGSIGTGGNFGAVDLGAAIGISRDAFYVTGVAGASMMGFAGEAGFFFGKICDASALYWDPDIQRIMTVVPIHGAYGFAKVRIPTIVDFDCLLRLSAGASMGAGLILEGSDLSPTFVGKFGVLIRGDALCIFTIEGEIVLAFRVGPAGLAWTGRGRFEVSLLFISVEITATLTYANGEFTGGID